jgi:putative transposase
MPDYRRNFVPGGTYFFTVLTQERRPILTTEIGRASLRKAVEDIQKKRPFQLFACVLLPEHLHAVWTLPPGDPDFSVRWRQIKEAFTRHFTDAGGTDASTTASRVRHRERAIWHRRFWEHTCRDEDDLKRCVDYVHWNPVKHGLVRSVGEYPWSSFHRFVRAGEYDKDWGRDVSFPGSIEWAWE